MKYYYLINGKIMSSNEKMPEIPNFIAVNQYYATKLRFEYSDKYDVWKNSLQPCEISESEFEKVEKHILKSQNIFTSTPIEVTDIISDKNGVISFKEKDVIKLSYCKCLQRSLSKPINNDEYECFDCGKQVEEIEAVGWDIIYLKYITENPNYKEPFCMSITEWLKLNYNIPTPRNI